MPFIKFGVDGAGGRSHLPHPRLPFSMPFRFFIKKLLEIISIRSNHMQIELLPALSLP